MSGMTMTVAEFLTARLDEDETEARQRSEAQLKAHGLAEWVADPTMGRPLREVEAKRLLLRDHGATDEDECPGCHAYLDGTWAVPAGEACPVLAALAAIYAVHPDYDETWRP